MKCLIIAAGKGSRLRSKEGIKPLAKLLGVPILERVIRSAVAGGADDIYVVTGFGKEKVETFLSDLSNRLGIPITPIYNPEWEKENGLSVLRAREYIKEKFILLMADHIFEAQIVESLQREDQLDFELMLAVDTNMQNPFVDMEDVTRVNTRDEKILGIGKGIKEFNAFDTGIFMCSPVLFEVLEELKRDYGNPTLSKAVQAMADRGKAVAVPVQGFWLDIDDQRAFKKAEEWLIEDLKGKANDGPVSRLLNRPISIWISKRVVNFNITPNQISIFSFACSVAAAFFLAAGSYLHLLLGGTLAQFASIVDGTDGEVARLKFMATEFGGWLDAVLDRYADAFLLFGLTWHVYIKEPGMAVLLAGFLAIIGSFMLSYTADKYDGVMKARLRRGIRVGRDLRVFLVFLGALANLPYLVLQVTAVLMNLETLRRIVICAHGCRRVCNA